MGWAADIDSEVFHVHQRGDGARTAQTSEERQQQAGSDEFFGLRSLSTISVKENR